MPLAPAEEALEAASGGSGTCSCEGESGEVHRRAGGGGEEKNEAADGQRSPATSGRRGPGGMRDLDRRRRVLCVLGVAAGNERERNGYVF